jgi:predicted HAD superfamily phosphohydrolase YqeG
MASYEIYDNAGQIPFENWYAKGIRIPVFDCDRTLTSFHQDDLIPKVIDGLIANMSPVHFPEMALVSNSSDPGHTHEVAEKLAETLGGRIVYSLCQADIPGKSRKPNPIMGLMVAEYFSVEPAELGIIGDRRLVDVSFGENVGAGAIALCGKVGKGDAWGVPALRVLERTIVSIETALGHVQQVVI